MLPLECVILTSPYTKRWHDAQKVGTMNQKVARYTERWHDAQKVGMMPKRWPERWHGALKGCTMHLKVAQCTERLHNTSNGGMMHRKLERCTKSEPETAEKYKKIDGMLFFPQAVTSLAWLDDGQKNFLDLAILAKVNKVQSFRHFLTLWWSFWSSVSLVGG